MGRMLIVMGEDAALAERLSGALMADGHAVSHASSLASAHLSIRSSGRRFDVIMVDRKLPDGDGLTLCREHASTDDHSLLVVLTPDGGSQARIECLRAGADECMQRPLDVEELRARIAAMLRRVRHAGLQEAPAHPIELTPRECSLLACIVERGHQPITPAALLSRPWSLSFDPRTGTVAVASKHGLRSLLREPKRTPDGPSEARNARAAQHHSDVFTRIEVDERLRSRS